MTIGVVAPASARRGDRLARGLEILQERGYREATGDHLYDKHGYLAGMDRGRAEDLTTMFANPEVNAIICSRGGYGSVRMLEYVDWDVVRSNPKVFVGFSDVTSVHLAMERHAGLATFYGPMVVTHGAGLSQIAADTFWRLLTDPDPIGPLDTAGASLQTLVSGKAEGPLAGGCLALLAAAVGTPEAPDFEGRIVVLEDVGDPAYRVDRLIMQLRRSGILERAAGFVIGTVTGWEKEEDQAGPPAITLDDVWRDLIAPLGKPTITGFPFGHVPNPLTIPLGCRAILDADGCALTIAESAVT